MRFMRDGKDGNPPEIIDVTDEVIRKEVISVLTEYGIVYRDTTPHELREDMAFLHAFRKAMQKGLAEVVSVVIKAISMGVLALIGYGIIYWLKIEGGK